MIDTLTPKGRIVAATMRLAAEHKWPDVTMAAIAEAAGMSLVELRREFTRKSDILAAFTNMVDEEVLRRAPRRKAAEPARDAIFDVIMSRFDVLETYKPAMRSISEAAALDGTVLQSLLHSQSAMLQAAGVDTDGPVGLVRITGLATVFARTFRTWLDDTDPGLARTMASLDRHLRSGERTLGFLDKACSNLGRMCEVLKPAPRPDAKPAEPPPPSPH